MPAIKHWGPEGEIVPVRLDALKDPRLSFKAKGVYCLLQNLPEGTYSPEDVSRQFSMNKTRSVTMALTELEAAGYIKPSRIAGGEK